MAMPRRIFLTEEQVDMIKMSYAVEPRKVLLIKKYLDKNFTKASIGGVGTDGLWQEKPIVALKGGDGTPVKNMSAEQLFYHLQSKFNGEGGHLYGDKDKTNKLIKTVMKAWYNDDITKEGLIRHANNY